MLRRSMTFVILNLGEKTISKDRLMPTSKIELRAPLSAAGIPVDSKKHRIVWVM